MRSSNSWERFVVRIVFGIIVLVGGASAAMLTVDDSGGADYTKIQDAIIHANVGDTILVYSGEYYENVDVNKQLTLRGIGVPIVDAGGSGSAITLAADGIILEGFTATNAMKGISVISNNNTLNGNNASLNTGYGISLSSSSNNRIYNNIFNNTNNVRFAYGPNINSWNTTLQFSPNIIGGPYLGGNVWAYLNGTGFSQTCSDNDKDGICDLPYTLDSNNIDYLPLAYNNINPTPTNGSIHNLNRGTNYTTIQAAINEASPGDEIHVDSGTYYENVNVTKQLTLRGIGMPIVDARGSGSAITLAADGIRLEGFTATEGGYYPEAGIKVTSSSNTLSGNNASFNNYYGISLRSSSNNNTLSGNNASNNNYGILLLGSGNNTLSNNNASNNDFDGIWLFISNNNTLRGNNALSNKQNGISLPTGGISGSSSNTLSNNNVSSNKQNGISLSSSSNNTLSNNNASSNNWAGISLQYSSNNTLSGNNVSNNGHGISVSSSSNNTLLNNTMTANSFNFGLFGRSDSDFNNQIDYSNKVDGKPIYYIKNAKNTVYDSSTNAGTFYCISCLNVTIRDMKLSNNVNGMFFWNTTISKIQNVNVSNNAYHGIGLGSSSNNTLINNNASNNYYGISLGSSSNNTLSGNNASNNYYGISLESSSNNNIYNNYFNNTVNFGPIGINTWNTIRISATNIILGPYIGGNFWAYPNGTGFGQTCTDGDKDGICDAQYTLDSNNIDYLALSMNFDIDTFSPANITNLTNITHAQTYINFTWTNPSDPDYHHVMLFLNGVFKTNITAPQNYYNFTGLVPDTVYELGTHTVDSSGNVNETWVNKTARTAPLSAFLSSTISLKSGWNLISVPLNLRAWELGEEAAVGNPLNVTPANCISSLYQYNTTSSLFEKSDHISDWGWWPATGSESFTVLEPGRGYWVMAQQDCSLTFTGIAPSDLEIPLNTGWNLIGWYSMNEAALGEEVLVGNPLNVTPSNSLTSIYRYNITSVLFEKSDHFDDWGWYPATGSESFIKIEPGRGYWIMTKNDAVWKHKS